LCEEIFRLQFWNLLWRIWSYATFISKSLIVRQSRMLFEVMGKFSPSRLLKLKNQLWLFTENNLHRTLIIIKNIFHILSVMIFPNFVDRKRDKKLCYLLFSIKICVAQAKPVYLNRKLVLSMYVSFPWLILSTYSLARLIKKYDRHHFLSSNKFRNIQIR